MIQQGMTERNADLPAEKRMALRIGVHVGDVVVDEADLLATASTSRRGWRGSPIPAASPSQRMSGGRCRARWVRPSPMLGEGSGSRTSPRPFGSSGWRSPRSPRSTCPARHGPSMPPPELPSLAVLPFQNMSGDPDQEFFADGLVEDIITTLSKLTGLRVVARNSSFVYKGRVVDVREAGQQLGVRYVLEGSVRRASNRIRITTQLIDTARAHMSGRSATTGCWMTFSRYRTRSRSFSPRRCRSG